MQRQMFREGGAAVPNQFKGFSKLPEEVQMKMNPDLARKYQQGGSVPAGGIMATAPAMAASPEMMA